MSPENLPQKNENDRAIVDSVIKDLTEFKANALPKTNSKASIGLERRIDALKEKIGNHLDSAGNLSNLDVNVYKGRIKITGIDPIVAALLSEQADKSKTSMQGVDIYSTKYEGLFIKKFTNPDKNEVHYNLVGKNQLNKPVNNK